MDQKRKLLIGAVALVFLLAGGTVLYSQLAPFVSPDLLHTQSAGESSAPPEGQEEVQTVPAPDFTVQNAEGEEVSLSQLVGEKPIVLNFWTSQCGPCRTEMPDFEAAHQQYGDQVQFVMVNSIGFMGEDEQSGRDYIAEQGFTFPVYYDTQQEATYTYGIRAFPTTFFIATEGNVVAYAESMLTPEVLMTGMEMLVPGLSGEEPAAE